MNRLLKSALIHAAHYLFWVALLVALWIYLLILKPQAGTMFRYVGF